MKGSEGVFGENTVEAATGLRGLGSRGRTLYRQRGRGDRTHSSQADS